MKTLRFIGTMLWVMGIVFAGSTADNEAQMVVIVLSLGFVCAGLWILHTVKKNEEYRRYAAFRDQIRKSIRG